MQLRDKVKLEDIWILWKDEQPVGYGLVNVDQRFLHISDLLLGRDIDAAQAVAAIVAEIESPYVQVSVSRPADIGSLQHTGYQIAHPSWAAFMVKPLVPEVTIEDACRLFGIGTDQFLISWLDET